MLTLGFGKIGQCLLSLVIEIQIWKVQRKRGDQIPPSCFRDDRIGTCPHEYPSYLFLRNNKSLLLKIAIKET